MRMVEKTDLAVKGWSTSRRLILSFWACTRGDSRRPLSIPESSELWRFTMRNLTQNAKVKFVPITFEDPEYSEDLKKKITGRAYEIFERRGRVPGHDVDDWRKAESEILRELH